MRHVGRCMRRAGLSSCMLWVPSLRDIMSMIYTNCTLSPAVVYLSSFSCHRHQRLIRRQSVAARWVCTVIWSYCPLHVLFGCLSQCSPLFSFGVVQSLAGQHYFIFFSSREECEILQSLHLSVSLFVCLSVCLCPLGYLKNHTSKLHKILHTCYVWPWLNPPLMTVQCVMYFQFCR